MPSMAWRYPAVAMIYSVSITHRVTPATAASTSASSKTTAAFFPPNSKDTCRRYSLDLGSNIDDIVSWWRCSCYEDLLHGGSSQGGDLLSDHGRAREWDDAHLVVVGSSINTWTSLGKFRWCWGWWGSFVGDGVFLCIRDVNDDNYVLLLLKMIRVVMIFGVKPLGEWRWPHQQCCRNQTPCSPPLSFPNIENSVCKDYKNFPEDVLLPAGSPTSTMIWQSIQAVTLRSDEDVT